MTESRRLRIIVEGQTEEIIVRELIEPHLRECGHWVYVSTLGGVSRWSVLKRQINLFRQDKHLDVLTTMIDYYGFPSDAPGMSTRPAGTPAERVAHVEAAVADDVGDSRFLPNLVLHETEAWVFAAGDQLAELLGDRHLASHLRAISDAAGGPELINDGPATAPSKRLLRRCPTYVKTVDGPIAIAELGLVRLRALRPRLDEWLGSLE